LVELLAIEESQKAHGFMAKMFLKKHNSSIISGYLFETMDRKHGDF
jgi:hypothetical protein